MRIQDTPEEQAFRAEARAWLEANARPLCDADADLSRLRGHSPEAEAAHFERCRAWQSTLYQAGWAGIPWPVEYGGRGLTPAHQMIFNQEQATFDATSGFIASTIALVGPALLNHGREDQRRHYLPRLLSAEDVWCQLFSEPDAGSDLANLRTRAELDGQDFVVNGQKVWTTGAQYADLGILLVRSNPDLPKHAGITCLIADIRTPGVEVRPLVTNTGGVHFNEVFFRDVRVPRDRAIGDLDGGWAVARTTLANESVMIGTSSVGTRDVDRLAALARRAGRADDPVVRQQLARVFVNERILALFRARMEAAVRSGRMPDIDGSVMKVFWAEARAFKDQVALELLGDDALLDGDDAPEHGEWQGAFLDFPMGTIGGGTSEVHRNGIGERVLQLPREPREDRSVPFRELKTTT
ncbi:MAG: acyl-CoA dehydrogenase family protein [Myxococcota bacterium]|nr:acyl-CoA dehydrogenase family protein [Myxococcota bacterium]